MNSILTRRSRMGSGALVIMLTVRSSTFSAPEMVMKAAETAKRAGITNVAFKQGHIEELPLEDGCIDVAISNCVMNDCADKVRAFREAYRVLKPGGRICISDLVTVGEFSEDAMNDVVWGNWLKVALSRERYLRAIEQAGFEEVTVRAETTFAMAENDERLKGRIASLRITARRGVEGT